MRNKTLDEFTTHHRHTTATDDTRHAALYDRVPGLQARIERGTLSDWEVATRLRTHYNAEFDLRTEDFVALETLGKLRKYGVAELERPDGTTSQEHYLLEGHRWLADALDVDFSTLFQRGLVQHPTIDGESRTRLLNRRFWELTPAGVDLVPMQLVGPSVGDPNEGLTHVLGVELYAAHFAATHDMSRYHFKRYHTIDGNVFDLVVMRSGRETWPTEFAGTVSHTVEVETGMSNPHATQADAEKLGRIDGASVWVFPTRPVLIQAVNTLSRRGYVGLDTDRVPGGAQLPDTLGYDACRERIRIATQQADLPYEAMTEVWTFSQLKTGLLEQAPASFYPARR